MRRSATALTIGLAFALAACGGSDNPTAAEVPETPAATPTASEAASATPTETASLAATASASSVPGASAEPSASASPPAASGLDPLVVPATATDLAGTGAWAAWPEKENVEGTDGEVVRAFAQDVWTSGDGMRIAYSQSSPSNTDCPSGTIVVANLTNNQFECSYDEAKPGAYYAFALSGDGRTVAFQTDAKLADKSSTPGASGYQIYAKNLDTGEVEPASTNADGTFGKGVFPGVRLSANGRTVAFLTSSRNLLPGGTDGMRHVLVKDLDTGALERASVSSTGTILASVTDDVFDLSADGRKVAFVSVRGDTKDVLIRDLDAKTTSRVWSGKGAIGRISLSADGTKVAFVYRGSPKAVYLADTTATTLQRVSLAADTFRDTGPYVAMSGDGRTVAYAVRSGFVVVDLATGKRKILPGDGGYLSPRALSAAGAVLIGLQFSGARLELWRR